MVNCSVQATRTPATFHTVWNGNGMQRTFRVAFHISLEMSFFLTPTEPWADHQKPNRSAGLTVSGRRDFSRIPNVREKNSLMRCLFDSDFHLHDQILSSSRITGFASGKKMETPVRLWRTRLFIPLCDNFIRQRQDGVLTSARLMLRSPTLTRSDYGSGSLTNRAYSTGKIR